MFAVLAIVVSVALVAWAQATRTSVPPTPVFATSDSSNAPATSEVPACASFGAAPLGKAPRVCSTRSATLHLAAQAVGLRVGALSGTVDRSFVRGSRLSVVMRLNRPAPSPAPYVSLGGTRVEPHEVSTSGGKTALRFTLPDALVATAAKAATIDLAFRSSDEAARDVAVFRLAPDRGVAR